LTLRTEQKCFVRTDNTDRVWTQHVSFVYEIPVLCVLVGGEKNKNGNVIF